MKKEYKKPAVKISKFGRHIAADLSSNVQSMKSEMESKGLSVTTVDLNIIDVF